jgi:hypothetical protein
MNERNERNRNRSTPTREDILIGRITDGEASSNDWAEIESIAESDPGVWHRLASSQRTHARMESAVEDAIAIAELIDAPDMRRVGRPVIARIREYGGWALAAGLALALGVTMLDPGGSDRSGEQRVAEDTANQNRTGQTTPFGDLQAGGFSNASDMNNPGGLMVSNDRRGGDPRASYDRYLIDGYQKGYVLRELTPALQEVRALPGGGYELIITRGHVERRKVTDLSTYRVLEDEWGNDHLVPDEEGTRAIPVRQMY